jgi:hypothetical protein
MSSERFVQSNPTALESSRQARIIPKRIIHIYCPPPGQPADLPLISRTALANSRLLHPDFEHVLFGTAEMELFVETEFPQYREVMASFSRPIQRFDFFRYLAVYRLGGFYFDLDVFLAERVEPLLEHGCVFPFEEITISDFLRNTYGIDWELANYGFGAAPGDPFLGALIANCVRGLHEPEWAADMMRGIPHWCRSQFFVPMTTGPGMVTRTLAENRQLRHTVTVLFPKNVCEKESWHRFGDFGVHLMQSSWRKRDGFIGSRLKRIWEANKRKRQLRISSGFGPLRLGEWKRYPADFS